jgi:sugar (pentulose or hexulose) kinase
MTSAAPGYLLGIDLGTSGGKAVAVDLDGALLATAEVRYPTTAPRPGWAVQRDQPRLVDRLDRCPRLQP